MAVKTTYEEKNYGEPLQYDPDFNGPYKHRSCTDILCFLLFFVFIGCWIGIGTYAFVKGDPDVLLVPKDSQGSRCGLDSHVANKPYLFFFDLTRCLQSIPFTGCRTPQVCVERCPDRQFLLNTISSYQYNPRDMICVNNVNRPRTKEEAQMLVNEGKCAQWYLHSTPVKNRCIPSIPKDYDLSDLIRINKNITHESLEKSKKIAANAEQVGQNVVDDVIRSWWKIAICLVISLVICIIYIVLMRWIAGIMVWISIFGVIGVLSFCIYFCTKKYKYFRDNPVTEEQEEASSKWESYLAMKDTWLVFLIISSVVLAIILLVLLFLRKRIVLAIALIKEASKAVSSVTSSLFFPIIPWCLQIGVIVFAVSVSLYLSTIGDPKYVVRNLTTETCTCIGPAGSYKNGFPCDPQIFLDNCRNVGDNKQCTEAFCHFKGVDSPTIISYLHGINVFGFFWVLFFVSAFSEMVLAGTFATWYWTFRKSDVPFFSVTESIIRALRYHIGTLAFGALIIAICRMIRVMLEYIDSKLKKFDNPFTKVMMCCCKCFFWCLENFIKFINRNAYIMCAIHGKNFCVSAKDAFGLLMRNVVRVLVLDKVTDFLIFLSKILVTAGVTCIAYAAFVTDIVDIKQSELNYNLVPVIIICIGTFFIASVFFSVFTMAVDTLFLCFLEDSERNDGSSEKPYYMSRDLMKILGKKNK
ncbi:hypothetical protein ILUMI_07651 [Ignelater luminosus]|uniref:Choline transporter-like protein n=1 Tax=Ignelater luminosus TaxID=2038154 RepID=A0A8K0D608_IGNLU|nr:hypothetical protein ILUMI_07651 [Ignelater luminosus]